MSVSTSKRCNDKLRFYSQDAIALAYDEQRFGGLAGDRVNRRELAIVGSLLGPSREVLDLGCGTGRLSAALAAQGRRVIALDGSRPMLELARNRARVPMLQGDAFAMPLATGALESVAALRIVFHFRVLDDLIVELARVTRPGGRVVFDTYRWSPRAWFAFGRGDWGGRIVAHADRDVEQTLVRNGFRVVDRIRCFLFSPYLYRLLPLPVVHFCERLERIAPTRLLARTFWCAERDATLPGSSER